MAATRSKYNSKRFRRSDRDDNAYYWHSNTPLKAFTERFQPDFLRFVVFWGDGEKLLLGLLGMARDPIRQRFRNSRRHRGANWNKSILDNISSNKHPHNCVSDLIPVAVWLFDYLAWTWNISATKIANENVRGGIKYFYNLVVLSVYFFISYKLGRLRK